MATEIGLAASVDQAVEERIILGHGIAHGDNGIVAHLDNRGVAEDKDVRLLVGGQLLIHPALIDSRENAAVRQDDTVDVKIKAEHQAVLVLEAVGQPLGIGGAVAGDVGKLGERVQKWLRVIH